MRNVAIALICLGSGIAGGALGHGDSFDEVCIALALQAIAWGIVFAVEAAAKEARRASS